MNKRFYKTKIIGLAVVFGLLIYFVNIRPAIANYTLRLGFLQIDSGNQYNSLYVKTKDERYKQLARDCFENGVVLMQKAIDFNTHQSTEFKGAFAEMVMGFHQAEILPDYKAGEYLSKVLENLETSILKNPRDVQIYAYTIAAYNLSAKYNLNYLDRAIELGNIAAKLSPNQQQVYFEIAKAKISQRKYDEALAYFQKAIDLNPVMLEAHWNLAIAYIKIGEMEKAKEQVKEMEEIGYYIDQPAEIKKWIEMYEKIGNYEKIAYLHGQLVQFYEQVLPKKPSATNYLKAAKANQQVGNIDKAKEYAQTAAEKDPTLQTDVANFLNSLE